MEKFVNQRNPILPLKYHIPDSEGHVMPDGRLYLYGSCDEREDVYCSDKYYVVSTQDMKEEFEKKEETEKAPLLFAPDCIEKNGKYYLYFCMADDSEGVAVSDHPEGPFGNPVQLPCGGIDPIEGI